MTSETSVSTEGAENGPDHLLKVAGHFTTLPMFPAAVKQYIVAQAKFREVPRLVNKLFSYDVRWRVIGYLLYLHCDREVYGPEGGATYGRLIDICTRRQEVSPRVLKTMLAMLQLTRFVQVTRSRIDARSKIYRPTERMNHFVKLWLTYGVTALDLLEPDLQRTRMLEEDATFTDRFLVSGGREHLAGGPLAGLMPEFQAFFGSREGASAVALAVLLARIDGTPVPSRTELAKRYGLSKSQVTKVLAEGEAEGFFLLDSYGRPEATQPLWDIYYRWVAIELAFYAEHMKPAGSDLLR